MKLLILLTLISCGKSPSTRATKVSTPIFSTPRTPPSYQLTHTCNRTRSSTKTVWNCYDTRSVYKMCVITYRAGFNTWSCNYWLYEMESELDSFQCKKISGGGYNTMDCYKNRERCVLKYGKILKENCYGREE